MDILKFGFLILLSGCQIGYLSRSAYNQFSLLQARVDVSQALQDPNISDLNKKKIRLAVQARDFAAAELGLKPGNNYGKYVQLDRPYVVYAVNAAPKWELKHYDFYYPFVGKMPYKGFFNEKDAQEEERELAGKDLDTYVRGVSAYSTLGWFDDPILSSMLTYDDVDLVNTVIHESVHATIYIKNSADFNERLAVFIGNLGTEMFYQRQEGENSETIAKLKAEKSDAKLFSEFITHEIADLDSWYKNLTIKDENLRQLRLKEIQTRFSKNIEPKLQKRAYGRFAKGPLNNAYILLYKTYEQDISDFDRAFEKLGRNLPKFLDFCRTLEHEKKPEDALKKFGG